MRSVILFVVQSLELGGTERHIVDVLPLLRCRGWQIRLFALNLKGCKSREIEQLGIRVEGPADAKNYKYIPFFFHRPLANFLRITSLIRVMFNPDIRLVHFFLPRAYLVGGFLSLFAPIPLRVMSRRSRNSYQLKYPFFAVFERTLHIFMDAVLSNSISVKNDLLQEGVDSKKIGLIYNGYDLGHLKNVPDRNATRFKLKIKNDALVLIIVANLFPYKGHMDLVKAVSGIATQMFEGWRLLIVGRDEGELAALRNTVKVAGMCNNVVFLGERLDVFGLMAASDIGLLCSHEEGFSNAIIEYMAHELPVIATDVGGNREAVINNQTGLIVPPKSPVELGQAILKLARNKHVRQKMGKAGKTSVKKHFTLESCVDKYSQFYNGLVKKNEKTVQEIIDSK
ncbi:glycosyltransferase [Alphaproteobacteria bacterium]|nr:glycosyltransferase [Alphaproteobacteria bacterium]